MWGLVLLVWFKYFVVCAVVVGVLRLFVIVVYFWFGFMVSPFCDALSPRRFAGICLGIGCWCTGLCRAFLFIFMYVWWCCLFV